MSTSWATTTPSARHGRPLARVPGPGAAPACAHITHTSVDDAGCAMNGQNTADRWSGVTRSLLMIPAPPCTTRTGGAGVVISGVSLRGTDWRSASGQWRGRWAACECRLLTGRDPVDSTSPTCLWRMVAGTCLGYRCTYAAWGQQLSVVQRHPCCCSYRIYSTMVVAP